MEAEFEWGTVTSRDGDRIDVTMGLSAKCEGCKLCDRDGGGELVMREVFDPLGASIGDMVEVEIPGDVKRSAAIALYVIPVTALLVGYLAGDLLGLAAGVDREITGTLGALGAAVVAFLGLRRAERAVHCRNTSSPHVRAIIPRGPEHE